MRYVGSMNLGTELAAIYRRDLKRLGQEVRAFPGGGAIWVKSPEVNNSAGNLVLHLEGNLREYIGRQLGGIPYQRSRDREFSQSGLSVEELGARVEALAELIPGVLSGLSGADLDRIYPEDVLGVPLTASQFVISLLGHFNYHLGQIDYLRRILTNNGPLPLASL